MNLKPEKLLVLFEELAEKLHINIVQDKGSFIGGSCVINDEQYIVLNKSRPAEQRLKVLAESFNAMNLNNTYLVPALREYLEKMAGLQ